MGAQCKKKNKLEIVDEVSTDLENVTLSWLRETNLANSITLPVYLYRDRKNLLFSLDFDLGEVQKTSLYERSVAVTANSSLS